MVKKFLILLVVFVKIQFVVNIQERKEEENQIRHISGYAILARKIFYFNLYTKKLRMREKKSKKNYLK
jgi:hypothetical protein